VGVRPKQPGLTADLRIDRSALQSQRDADRLTNDLLARGFLLQPNPDDKNLLELIAREGEMFVGIDDGLLYRLYFGRVFTGSEQELEIGLKADNADDKKDVESTDGDKDAAGESGDDSASDGDAEKEEVKASGKPGRYVFVRVNFDPTLLGSELTEPVEPQESDEIKALEEKVKQAEANGETPQTEATEPEAPAQDSDKDAANGEDAAQGDAEEEGKEGDAAATPEETDTQKLKRLREEFASSQVEYRTQQAAYKVYQQKIKEGQEKSEELNRRFALWYYVIPGESYDKLSLNRDDLIEAKESTDDAAEPDAQANDNAMPTLGGLGDAVMKDAELSASPESANAESAETPKAEQPEPTTADPSEPSSSDDSPKADSGNAEEPKAEPSPPAQETPPSAEPAGDSPTEIETETPTDDGSQPEAPLTDDDNGDTEF
jgi:hypothetical protein